MSESNQTAEGLRDDLQFVRKAVEAKERTAPPATVHLVIWAIYSLICPPAFDYLPRYGGRINLGGWVIAAVVSYILGKRATKRSGEFDREMMRRNSLHWYGCIGLMMASVYGLALGHSGLNEIGAGQISIILVGFMYFTAGVHFPDVRFMRWAGPVIVLAGIGIGWVPHLRWTAMGLIFAACLMTPVVFGQKKTIPTVQA